MTRITFFLTLIYLGSIAHAQYLYCPAPEATGSSGMRESIWDLDAGGISTGKAGEFAEFVMAANLGPDSTCEIAASLYTYDLQGNLLGNTTGTINHDNPFIVWQRPQGVLERLTAIGHTTGCTAAEESAFTAVINHLKSKGGDDEVVESMQLGVRYFQSLKPLGGEVAKLGAINTSQHLRYDPLCPGRAATASAGDGSDLLDATWGFQGLIMTDWASQQSHLVFLVTPRLLTPGCNEGSSNYRVKVKVSFVYHGSDSAGNHFSDTLELDEDTPYMRVPIPNGSNGERVYQVINAAAETDGCSMGQPSDLMVYLDVVDTATDETFSRKRLPARVGRNPQTGQPIMIPARLIP